MEVGQSENGGRGGRGGPGGPLLLILFYKIYRFLQNSTKCLLFFRYFSKYQSLYFSKCFYYPNDVLERIENYTNISF